MTFYLHALRKIRIDGEVEELTLERPASIIVGPRNSSKTTALRMIDFCLGDSDTAEHALGSAVSEKYLGLELELTLSRTRFTLRRAIQPTFGLLTKIVVADAQYSARDLQDWLMAQLDWPLISLPKGRDPRLATELVPLTFRSLFRHMYRKEGSWLEFASREEEFLRRAVLSYFLGISGSDFAVAEFEVGEAARHLQLIEDRLRASTEDSARVVESITTSLGLSSARLEDLEVIRGQLRQSLATLRRSRADIQSSVESSSDFVREPGERFRTISARLDELGLTVNELRATLQAYRESEREIDAQVLRLKRAASSVEIVEGVQVRFCPACEQTVSPNSDRGGDACYLCGQPVDMELRRRRIELEIGTLARERVEIGDVVEATERELEQGATESKELSREREELRTRLDAERAALIAPYLSQLESLSAQVGATEKQLAALEGLNVLQERRTQLEQQRIQAIRRLEAAEARLSELSHQRELAMERCTALAEAMNAFLGSVRAEPWGFGEITVSIEEMSFYVGTRPWESALGAEAKVLFLLAYHEALLRLSQLPGTRCPQLVILDNPVQQGIGDGVVTEALDRLIQTAEETESQLIVTLPRSLSIQREHHRITLTEQFAPDSDSEYE